jgi:hypothetical protein
MKQLNKAFLALVALARRTFSPKTLAHLGQAVLVAILKPLRK